MNTKRFAANLRAAREARALSQGDAGARCGLSPAHVSHFESARRLPSLPVFLRICDGLLVSADELLTGCNDTNREGETDA